MDREDADVLGSARARKAPNEREGRAGGGGGGTTELTSFFPDWNSCSATTMDCVLLPSSFATFSVDPVGNEMRRGNLLCRSGREEKRRVELYGKIILCLRWRGGCFVADWWKGRRHRVPFPFPFLYLYPSLPPCGLFPSDCDIDYKGTLEGN